MLDYISKKIKIHVLDFSQESMIKSAGDEAYEHGPL